jgi:nicotinamidase-related amidase
MKIHLLVIDPQNDFCNPNGSLYVPGAEEDIKRLANLVTRMKGKLDDIHITLDSHRKVDIAHPIWWKDSSGAHPSPFTLISAADVEAGRWTTTMPSFLKRSLLYLRALEAGKRYPHTIWPEHCLIGDEGHNVAPELAAACHDWEQRFAQVDFVTKGSNPWTEHFSAVQAEVPDPEDPTTQINTGLIKTLEEADIVLLAGQASTHCVMNTVGDIASSFADASTIGKLVWLTDGTSPVPDPPGTTLFSDKLKQVYGDLKSKGMQTSSTSDFLRQVA